MRVALVHDWLTERAGSERVLEALAAMYPEAAIHTLMHDPAGMGGSPLNDRAIITSPLQRLPRWLRRRRGALLGAMPWAVEQLDVRDAEVVISSSHAVAKGVLTRADQLHICYCHTPMRYAWDLYHDHLDWARLRGVRRMVASMILHRVRSWDRLSADRPDVYVANSQTVAERIFKHYRREARVIYPPVDIERFRSDAERDSYYLVLGRLVPYKCVDVLVRAWAGGGVSDRELVIAGDGPDMKKLQKLAGELRSPGGPRGGNGGNDGGGCAKISFLGRVGEDEAADLLARCRGLLFAAEEDFGIVPVEAMASGAPVVAYGRGGATETVLPGENGVLFRERTPAAVAAAVAELERGLGTAEFQPTATRRHAERFGVERFTREFAEVVDEAWSGFKNGKRRLRW